MVKDQMRKHREAKDAIKALNEFLKKQIDLVKQESALRLKVRMGVMLKKILIYGSIVRRNSQNERSQWVDTRQR